MPRPKLKNDEILQVIGVRVPPGTYKRYHALGTVERKQILATVRKSLEQAVNRMTGKALLERAEKERIR